MMQGQRLKDGLVKILKVCCRNGFFSLQSTGRSLISIQYGPLGSLFTKNIWREWLSSIINNVDVRMFPMEVMKSKASSKPNHANSVYFLPVALKNYRRFLPLFEVNIPFGFALYGPTERMDQKENLLDNALLRKFESSHGLFITFFCPPKKSSDWLNYWARHRYRWWRKFSSIPSKFYMSDVSETKEGNQQISLMMEFPWGKENLETITLCNENFVRNNIHAFGLQRLKNQVVPSVIVCESELNMSAFAYLSNSFSEKWRNKEIHKLFQLHTKLAPYKVCISVKGDHTEESKSLREIAVHLEKELKKCRVDVFPCFDTLKKDCKLNFSRFDEMGIPYTIVLNKRALHSGIAGLRNRDTTLEENVHIAELTPKILKYLQMKSFDSEES